MKKISNHQHVHRYTSENENFWQQHITALIKSGMTRADYCKAYHINYHRFGYWKKKIKDKNHTAVNTTTTSLQKSSNSALLPVKIMTSEKKTESLILCTLNLTNGSVLHIHDEQALSLILARWA